MPLIDGCQWGLVLADAEVNSERDHQYVRHYIGTDSVTPTKHGRSDQDISDICSEMRQQFSSEVYR